VASDLLSATAAAAADPLLAAVPSPPGYGGGPSHDIDLTTWWRGASSSGGGKGRCWLQRFPSMAPPSGAAVSTGGRITQVEPPRFYCEIFL